MNGLLQLGRRLHELGRLKIAAHFFHQHALQAPHHALGALARTGQRRRAGHEARFFVHAHGGAVALAPAGRLARQTLGAHSPLLVAHGGVGRAARLSVAAVLFTPGPLAATSRASLLSPACVATGHGGAIGPTTRGTVTTTGCTRVLPGTAGVAGLILALGRCLARSRPAAW